MGVCVLAIGLTVCLGGLLRHGAGASPGTFLSSPISPLPTPTVTTGLHSNWLPVVRGGAYHKHWLPVIIDRS
jgi:hypothetical protein